MTETDRPIRSERETTPKEAMGVIRGEHNRAGRVRANTGSQVVVLFRSRFGGIRADLYIDLIDERRVLDVTEGQAREIIMSAHRPDEASTLKLLPPDENTPADD
jgi:hypothetical protein